MTTTKLAYITAAVVPGGFLLLGGAYALILYWQWRSTGKPQAMRFARRARRG